MAAGVASSLPWAAWPFSQSGQVGTHLAWVCAVVSVLGSTVFALLDHRTHSSLPRRLASLGAPLGLVSGLAAASVLAYQLIVRWLYLLIELATVTPSPPGSAPTLDYLGLLTLVLLGVSCLAALLVTRNRHFGSGLTILGMMAAGWLAGQYTAIESPISGGIRLGGATQTLAVCLTLVLVAATITEGMVHHVQRWQLARYEPDSLAAPGSRPTGFLMLCLGLATLVVLLGLYHVCVPIGILPAEFRHTAWLGFLCGGLGSASLFTLANRYWSPAIADVSVALAMLGLTNLAMALAPASAVSMAQRYPVVFTQILFGLAVVIAVATWLSKIWEQQLDQGVAWTTAGRLIPHARRCAAASGWLAVLVAGIMAVWPRLIAVNISDLSMSRITAGLAANLLVLLALLWGTRQLKKLSMQVLVAGSLCVTIGFLVVRMLPYTVTFG